MTCLPAVSSSLLYPLTASGYGLLFSVMKWRTDCVGEEDASGGVGAVGGSAARGLCRLLEGEARRRSMAGGAKKRARVGKQSSHSLTKVSIVTDNLPAAVVTLGGGGGC